MAVLARSEVAATASAAQEVVVREAARAAESMAVGAGAGARVEMAMSAAVAVMGLPAAHRAREAEHAAAPQGTRWPRSGRSRRSGSACPCRPHCSRGSPMGRGGTRRSEGR